MLFSKNNQKHWQYAHSNQICLKSQLRAIFYQRLLTAHGLDLLSCNPEITPEYPWLISIQISKLLRLQIAKISNQNMTVLRSSLRKNLAI